MVCKLIPYSTYVNPQEATVGTKIRFGYRLRCYTTGEACIATDTVIYRVINVNTGEIYESGEKEISATCSREVVYYNFEVDVTADTPGEYTAEFRLKSNPFRVMSATAFVYPKNVGEVRIDSVEARVVELPTVRKVFLDVTVTRVGGEGVVPVQVVSHFKNPFGRAGKTVKMRPNETKTVTIEFRDYTAFPDCYEFTVEARIWLVRKVWSKDTYSGKICTPPEVGKITIIGAKFDVEDENGVRYLNFSVTVLRSGGEGSAEGEVVVEASPVVDNKIIGTSRHGKKIIIKPDEERTITGKITFRDEFVTECYKVTVKAYLNMVRDIKSFDVCKEIPVVYEEEKKEVPSKLPIISAIILTLAGIVMAVRR